MKLSGKKKIIVIAGAVVSLLCVGLFMSMGRDNGPDEVTQLARPGYGENEYVYTLQAQYDNGNYTLEVPVSARKLTGSEMQVAFDSAFELICDRMPGANPSLSEVRSDLVFTTSVPEYGIKVDYTLDDYSVINCFGEVTNKDVGADGAKYSVHAEISYNEFSQIYEIPVTVLPPEYSDEEILINKITSELEKADGVNIDEYMQLPETVDGSRVIFTNQPESKTPVILLLALAAFVFWYYKKFVMKKKEDSKREEQLKLDYSEIVSKLSLLMGAGMSGANAFGKISHDYITARETKNEPARYAYEEIAATSNRISSGISEAEAYAAFGRACRVHSYIKLASLMTQNVVKGAEGFNAMLANEVTEAFAERKALARTKGEEAGTKLLMPMILMLGIVLVIIIVPAFMSF